MARLTLAVRQILTNRVAFSYTLAAGLISGEFVGYLNSAQQVFQAQYRLGRLFPLYSRYSRSRWQRLIFECPAGDACQSC